MSATLLSDSCHILSPYYTAYCSPYYANVTICNAGSNLKHNLAMKAYNIDDHARILMTTPAPRGHVDRFISYATCL